MSKSGWKIWSLPFSKSAKELIWNVHTLKEAVGNNPPYLLEYFTVHPSRARLRQNGVAGWVHHLLPHCLSLLPTSFSTLLLRTILCYCQYHKLIKPWNVALLQFNTLDRYSFLLFTDYALCLLPFLSALPLFFFFSLLCSFFLSIVK